MRMIAVLLFIILTLMASVNGQASSGKGDGRNFNEIPEDPVEDSPMKSPFGSLFSLGAMIKSVIRRVNKSIEYCVRVMYGQFMPILSGKLVTRGEMNDAIMKTKKWTWAKVKSWRLLEDYLWLMDSINFEEIHDMNEEL